MEKDFLVGGVKVAERRILKNAYFVSSKICQIQGEDYSLVNTCGFDSVSQLFLKVLRNPELRSMISEWTSPFAKFVTKLFQPGKFC